MKTKIVISAVVLAAVAASAGLLHFTHLYPMRKAAAAPAPAPPVPIVATTVVQHDVPIYLTGVGTVIAYNTDHVDWQGCSLHDLIQPAFSLLVGAVLPYSIAARQR